MVNSFIYPQSAACKALTLGLCLQIIANLFSKFQITWGLCSLGLMLCIFVVHYLLTIKEKVRLSTFEHDSPLRKLGSVSIISTLTVGILLWGRPDTFSDHLAMLNFQVVTISGWILPPLFYFIPKKEYSNDSSND